MPTIIFIIFVLLVILYIVRDSIISQKSNQLYKILDKYGSIQVLDNKSLIAVLYKDRTIDWIKETSIYKQSKIKLISDRFEEEVIKLKEELNK